MRNGVISKNEYMRSRLRKFSKEELIDGILSLQFTTIDLIVQRCEHKRVLKECEEDEKKEQQFATEREELRKETVKEILPDVKNTLAILMVHGGFCDDWACEKVVAFIDRVINTVKKKYGI